MIGMVTSLRVPEETRQGFEELARLSGRTRGELMIEALEEYLAAKRQCIALIQEGEAALDEGRSKGHGAVINLLKDRGMLNPGYVAFAGHSSD
jgi:predicted transcriptional regulator